MVWKKVNNADPGTATKHGGNDFDKVSDALSGVNVADPIVYNTDFNTLKDSTTNAAGDLLKGNGTKYVRWAKGTANQQIRVKNDGTDLEYFTPSAGGGGADVLPLSYTYIFYVEGGIYKAKNGITGAVHGTTSATNAAIVINSVISTIRAAGSNAHAVLHFAPGTYNIAKAGVPESADCGVNWGGLNRLIFQGSGRGTTTFICTESGTNMLAKYPSVGRVAYIGFKDLTIDGANISACPLACHQTDWLNIERCILTRGNSPFPNIFITEVDFCLIRDTEITNHNAPGDLVAFDGNNITVEDCFFTRPTGPHGYGGGGLTTGGTGSTIIRNNRWEGYIGYGCISLENGGTQSNNIIIEGNQFINSAQSGSVIQIIDDSSTDISHDSNSIMICNNQILNSGQIKLERYVHNVHIVNNQIWFTPAGIVPIYCHSNIRELTIANNTIKETQDTAFSAITIDATSGGSTITKFANIHDNIFSFVAARAIDIRGLTKGTIHHNQFYDVGAGTNDVFPAIHINNIDAGASGRDKILIESNRFDVSQQSNKLWACVQVGPGSTDIVIRDNIMPTSAWASFAIFDAGTATTIKNNRGHTTESEGATSVADGGTISHGLVTTPGPVTLTPSLANTILGVTAKSSTTFTVSVKTDAGAAGTTQTVYWRATV